MIDVNNIFLISLWKLSVEEVVNNRHYHLPKSITKIALILNVQKLSKPEEELLELHDWSVIEVEPTLIDASAEELENYIKSHFDEINRNIKELEIISPEFEEVIIIKDDVDTSFDSFLNID
jgi:hypothetical protein